MKERCLTFPIWPKKYIEFQIGRWENSCSIFRIDADITRHCDHSGCSFTIEFLGFHFYFTFYDRRHWNDEEKRWMVEEDYKKIKDMPEKTEEEKKLKYEELADYYDCSQFGCFNRSVEKLLKQIDLRDREINKLGFMKSKKWHGQ